MSTAAAPILMGALLDSGVTLRAILSGMAAVNVLAIGLSFASNASVKKD